MKNTLSIIGLGLLSITLLVGCDNPAQIDFENQRSFENPYPVGVINGKKLYVVIIKIPNGHSHYVYFFKGEEEKSVSVNRSVLDGKTTYNSVQVLLNGKEVSSVVVTNSLPISSNQLKQ
jgi:hypothetical protein